MIINVIGECDKRPVIYTLMKICQTLGDVLLVTNNSRLLRLSDTRESGGHYQNTMIVVTGEGIDDFLDEFTYSYDDFNYVIVDGIVTADADCTIYVQGMVPSDVEKDMLEYVDEYKTIKLYEGRMTFERTLWNCEEFEAYRTMCAIGEPIANAVAEIIAPYSGKSAQNLAGIAMTVTSTHKPKSNFPSFKLKGGKK